MRDGAGRIAPHEVAALGAFDPEFVFFFMLSHVNNYGKTQAQLE